MVGRLILVSGVIILSVVALITYAEDIKSYSECDVCPGSIHYGPDEARELLGKEGQNLISQLRQFNRITINLDEVLPFNQPSESDKPHAVSLHGTSLVIYLQDSADESYIQIVTDYFQARQTGSPEAWQPEIYVGSGKANAVDLSDSVDEAWKKIKESNIYQWAMDSGDNVPWTDALRNRLLQALKVLKD